MSRVGLDRLLAATLVAVCLALYFGWFIHRGLHEIGPASFLTHFDWQSYFRPRFWLGSQELLAGRLPLWNQYEWGGLPLLATGQPAALYPPKAVLYAVFPTITAHWVFLILHYVLFSLGAWLFLRDQRIRGPALFVGIVASLFGTVLLNSNYHPIRIGCFAWMPLQFLLAERVGREANRLAFAGLALVVALQLLAGYPEFTLDIGLLLGFHAVASFAVGKWQRPPWLTVPVIGVAFLLGGIAAGAQLVPLAELAGISHRVNMEPFEPNEWMKARPVPIRWVPGLIVFALVAFWQKRARSAFAILSLCWALRLGGWKLLRLVPGLNMVRFPFGWELLALFPFGWLAAIGCESMIGPSMVGPRARRVGLWLVGMSGVALVIVWLGAWYRSRHGGSVFFDVNIGTSPALWLAVTGGLTLTALSLASLLRREPPSILWLFPLGLVTLAHLAATPYVSEPAPFEPPKRHGQVATLHRKPNLIRGRTFSVYDIVYGYEITDRLPSPLGIEVSFLPHRCRRIIDAFGLLPLDWNRFASAHGFLDAMNVELVAGSSTLSPLLGAHGMSLVRRSGEDALFRNPDPMGPAWVNYAARRIDDPERMLSYVLGGSFDPHREVLLERALQRSYPEPTPVSQLATPVDRVHRRSPMDVEYSVTLPRPGVFVVSESAYPGWVATVDGVSAEWFTADYVLRGIELEPGSHIVRFEYRPASVKWGLLASAVGVAVIAWLMVRALRAHRASGEAQRQQEAGAS